jgi:isomerase DpgB
MVKDSFRRVGGGLAIEVEIDSRRPLAELTAAVDDACRRAESSTESPVMVLTFGATAPENRHWPGPALVYEVTRWERAVRRLEQLECVRIAVLPPGICGGPALDLLLVTDYRIAAATSGLLLPINDGQFWPGMAMYRLVQQVGLGRARQLVMWSHKVSATQAQDLGLVDEIAASAPAAADAAAVMLHQITGGDLAVRRQILLEAPTVGFEEALGVHLAACDRELRRLRRSSAAVAGEDGAGGRERR